MDRKRAKDTANSFWMAAARSMEQRRISPTSFQMLIVPGVVCTAFSVELGFKTLLAEDKDPPRGHDLRKLYDQLPHKHQDELAALCSPTRAQFETSLSAVAKVFEEWRYVYEFEMVQVDMAFLTRLSDSVHTIINRDLPNNSFELNRDAASA